LGKVAYSARQEFVRGEEAYRSGKLGEAIVHYERAIQWYTPFSGAVRRAVRRLWEIGTVAEQQAKPKLALEAYQALRGSLYAVQSFYLPYRRWIPKSEAKIAVLMARSARTGEPDATKRARDTARFARMLQRDVAPGVGGSILVEIGFLGWIGATVGFICRAFTSRGTWVWRRGLLWGGG
jgi:hypothetical protein